LRQAGRHTEADEHLETAVRCAPNMALPLELLGDRRLEMGRVEDAATLFRRAIEAAPDRPSAYGRLVSATKMGESDRLIVEKMEELASRGPTPAKFLFAIGKALDDMADYENAIRYFDRANAVGKETRRPFNRDLYTQWERRIVRTFDETYLRLSKKLGQRSDLPTLIVGMPRSGTTLLNQILSSHADVGSAGELRFWSENTPLLLSLDAGPGSIIDDAKAVDAAEDYLRILREAAPHMRRVIDKAPHNYTFIGFIHILFPYAKFIHCRRNPVDTCLSIYVTDLGTGVYEHDRDDIVFVYRLYQRLMEHWKRVLPPEVMLEVDYEDVVGNREATIRRIIEFMGLQWDASCLNHQSNPVEVSTPSRWQARQAIYRTSLQRWRNYEPWLGAFKDFLQADERS
jgi:tetratricopeptide (TPR) repeat protein